MNLIVEGIDRIGKDTFIKNLNDKFGYQIIHSGKPQKLSVFDNNYQKFQENYFRFWFNIIKNQTGFIFNRFHLGEYVYAPLYRNYEPGVYLKNLEQWCSSSVSLILLYTDDFSIIKDDGKSFDFSQKEIEQKKFLTAFDKSCIISKQMIKVNDGNSFRSEIDIINSIELF